MIYYCSEQLSYLYKQEFLLFFFIVGLFSSTSNYPAGFCCIECIGGRKWLNLNLLRINFIALFRLIND